MVIAVARHWWIQGHYVVLQQVVRQDDRCVHNGMDWRKFLVHGVKLDIGSCLWISVHGAIASRASEKFDNRWPAGASCDVTPEDGRLVNVVWVYMVYLGFSWPKQALVACNPRRCPFSTFSWVFHKLYFANYPLRRLASMTKVYQQVDFDILTGLIATCLHVCELLVVVVVLVFTNKLFSICICVLVAKADSCVWCWL